MRRLLAMISVVVAVGAIVVLGSGASTGTGSSYLVDAEFRNAFSVIPGEDVKIAGVKVGVIKDLDVTPRQTASVLMEITAPGFGDWRSDATCSIRPQSLIGEKFVECTPTQPRAQGAAPAPLLKTGKRGGDTVSLLPVGQTRRPVDIDLVNNVLRLPYRERLTVILNEFGAGVAGHGKDLKTIIRTADPSLKATDDVLKLLADQDKTLNQLAVNSDRSLAPLARDSQKVADFITQARKVSVATADKRADLERNIQKLPAFLRTLRPTMQRLGSLSDQGTPLLRDLTTAGPGFGRFIKQLGPFSQAGTPALTSLGDASVTGRTALDKSRPIITDLKNFASQTKPVARNLRELTESLRDTGGIERLMDYAFYQVSAINGFDKFGHYLRAQLLVNLCSQYNANAQADPQCTANFQAQQTGTAASARRASSNPDRVLARTDAVLRGQDPAAVLAADKSASGSSSSNAASSDAGSAPASSRSTSPTAATGVGAPSTGASSVLDYLLGGGR